MTRGVSESLPTALPDRYERLFPWGLDRRCSTVRQIAGDLMELWQDLGSVEHLSVQKRWLAERIVFMRRRMVAYEEAVEYNEMRSPDEPERPLPMTAGEYSNFANVTVGHLKALGLERRARPTKTLREVMAGSVSSIKPAERAP